MEAMRIAFQIVRKYLEEINYNFFLKSLSKNLSGTTVNTVYFFLSLYHISSHRNKLHTNFTYYDYICSVYIIAK
jgi:hypothetical protein